jgi:ankyrin repeat protein
MAALSSLLLAVGLMFSPCAAVISQDGNTPLHLAAVVGNTGNIKVLCDALGPQGVAACNKQQRTPLHAAAKYGRAGAVQQLLTCLADMPGADQVGTKAAAGCRSSHQADAWEVWPLQNSRGRG